MPYSFDWSVKDEPSYNDYAHQEKSDGKTVSGSYRVLLPDGRVQTVTYKDDGYGYVADVQYSGEPRYPEYKPAASYKVPASYAPVPAYPAKQPAYPAPKPVEYATPKPADYVTPAAPAYPKNEYPSPKAEYPSPKAEY